MATWIPFRVSVKLRTDTPFWLISGPSKVTVSWSVAVIPLGVGVLGDSSGRFAAVAPGGADSWESPA